MPKRVLKKVKRKYDGYLTVKRGLEPWRRPISMIIVESGVGCVRPALALVEHGAARRLGVKSGEWLKVGNWKVMVVCTERAAFDRKICSNAPREASVNDKGEWARDLWALSRESWARHRQSAAKSQKTLAPRRKRRA